jgi:membrane protease YdiL (CAAX protease family)
MRSLLSRCSSALRDLGRACLTLEGLALLAVTLVLMTRHALTEGAGAHLLAPLWGTLGRLHRALGEALVQGQIVAIVLQLGVPLLCIALVHRRSLRDFGAGLGDWRFWVPIAGVILVGQVLVVALYLRHDPAYIARYPSLDAARGGGALFWAWEASRLAYLVSWEFLFRGYLLFALVARLGRLSSVVQMVPFALTHVASHKPVSEIYFTLVSGTLSGLFAHESRSFWPLALLHAAGAILLDVLLVYRG